MKTVTFPDGTTVPALGQGTWNMGDHRDSRTEEIASLREGIDLGMTVIDTAEMYGSGRSEELVGEAISGRRDEVFLVSKVLPYNASRKGVPEACEASLRRLGTDYLDLYLLHWAGSIPFAETVEALERLVDEGKIARWGVSNLDPGEMDEIEAVGGENCMTDQVLYNLTRRGPELDLFPWLAERAMPVMAYSPVEQGRLLGDGDLEDFAADKGATPAQIALAWLLARDGVMPIPKAGQREHVRENRAAADLVLDESDLARLDSLFPAPTHPVSLQML